MAVPKRKTSKSRRDKRRATHKLEAPRVNTCPQCGSPKRAHRVCPTCGTYKGREVEPLRLRLPCFLRFAVDALGGDNAPREVILGALDAAADGVDVTLFGPSGLDTQGLPLLEST